MAPTSADENRVAWAAHAYFEGGAVLGDGADVEFDVSDPITGEIRRARLSKPTMIQRGLATVAYQDFEFSFFAPIEDAMAAATGFANHLADIVSFHTTKPMRAGIKGIYRVGDVQSTLVPLRALAAGYTGENVTWDAVAGVSARMADGDRHLAKRSMRWLRRSYSAADTLEAYVAAAIAIESLRPTFPDPPAEWVTDWRRESGSNATDGPTKAERVRYFALTVAGIASDQWSRVWHPRDKVLHGAVTEDAATIEMLASALPDLRRVAVRGIVAALDYQPGVLQGAERPQVAVGGVTLEVPGVITFQKGPGTL